jgi:predicted esterase
MNPDCSEGTTEGSCRRIASGAMTLPRILFTAALAAVAAGCAATTTAHDPAVGLAPVAPVSAAPRTVTVTASTDSSMRYALYLPPGHSTDKKWPTLVVMDPRGRAEFSASLFTEAASRLGWVVLSSFNTASDDDRAPNEKAVNAMMADAWAKYAADPQRIYLAGFSGTARVAWVFASQTKGAARGVIAAGAGLTGFAPLTTLADTGEAAVAFLSSIGDADYNWSELRATDGFLSRMGTPHRAWDFVGGHQWPPRHIATAQLEWFEARAMRTGYAIPDEVFLEARRARIGREVDSLLKADRPLQALSALDELLEDMVTHDERETVKSRIARLRQSGPVKAAIAERESIVADEASAIEDVAITLTRIRLQANLPAPEQLAAELKIPELRKLIASGSRRQTLSAKRQLDRILGLLFEYEPTSYMSLGDNSRARLMLEVGALVDPARAQKVAEANGLHLTKR